MGFRISAESLAALVLAMPLAHAQQGPDTHQPTIEEITQLKQNPVSGLRSVFLEDETATIGAKAANAFSVQPVWPFDISEDWKLITYTIMPVASLPALGSGNSNQGETSGLQSLPAVAPAGDRILGLGNILFNGYITLKKPEGSFVWGVGPSVQLPTRTNPALGSNRVSAGPALLLYDSSGPWAGGVVLQNFWSLGGTGTNRVNNFATQYILYYNFPDGWSLESNATVRANWLAAPQNRWLVPLGGGIGKTFQISSRFYSASLQGFCNVERPSTIGKWAVIATFQIIF